MKTIMLCFTFFVMVINAHSQEIKPDLQLTSEQYLKKSRSQQTTAWVLFGIGTSAIVGGVAVSAGGQDELTKSLNTVFIGAPLMLLGLTLDIISIPVFVAADKNKKRSMEAVTTIKFEEVPSWSGGAVKQSNVPTMAIKVRF